MTNFIAGTLTIFTVFHLRVQLKCCGVNSSSDWKNFGAEGNSVPDSCCVNVTKNCGLGAMTDPAKVYQKVNTQWLIIILKISVLVGDTHDYLCTTGQLLCHKYNKRTELLYLLTAHTTKHVVLIQLVNKHPFPIMLWATEIWFLAAHRASSFHCVFCDCFTIHSWKILMWSSSRRRKCMTVNSEGWL